MTRDTERTFEFQFQFTPSTRRRVAPRTENPCAQLTGPKQRARLLEARAHAPSCRHDALAVVREMTTHPSSEDIRVLVPLAFDTSTSANPPELA